ncbi:Rrf2 family transcriptional regulator [Cohnella phaseoli]|uniref:Rrf2 family protein n=1 Tax=Cohnella phaseoli TaxID=456490 RepID=A0A3D9IMH6_9BACL|nr:Rrf2 family transcriptional regulator [Cohnella phaseoli]RED62984.1 Rrf2 family protein [Cohnella phaseoli]
MKISSRFAIAVHVLSLLAVTPSAHNTSEWIAGSVGTNPVIIRRILGQLKKAGLATVKAGSGGARLSRGLDEISLLDVYRAVDVVEEGKLFHIHNEPNPQCQVGANIQAVLQLLLARAQEAMEGVLADITMEELVSVLSKQIQAQA